MARKRKGQWRLVLALLASVILGGLLWNTIASDDSTPAGGPNVSLFAR